VPTPPTWSRSQVEGGELLRAPDRALEILVLPMTGAQVVVPRWLYAVLIRDQPTWDQLTGIEPANVINGELTTASGWKAFTLEATLGNDQRMVAYFTVLDYAATVVATWKHDDAGARDEAIALLARATPDLASDAVTGLADLLGQPPPSASKHEGALRPEAWRRAFSGGDVILIPIADPDSGWIRCAARRAPLQSVSRLFADLQYAVELGITAEGEYFALAISRGEQLQKILAVVFGAESYTRIDAITLVPERFDMFVDATRELAYQTILGYGSPRLRPYYYEPPPSWIPIVRPGSTVWASPSCAWRYHVLRVFDACPVELEAAVRTWRFETLAAEFLVEPPRGPAVYYTQDGLECRVFAHTGKFGERELRVLDGMVIDENYCYPLRIECDPALLDESMKLFEEVVRTIVPLPAPTTTRPQRGGVFTHWSE
jgi:hypothetical protein